MATCLADALCSARGVCAARCGWAGACSHKTSVRSGRAKSGGRTLVGEAPRRLAARKWKRWENKIMGGSATLTGMYGVIYFTGQRIAAKQMATIAKQEQAQGYKKTSSVKNLDSIELTPWVNIPLKTPLMLLSSFVGAAAAKAITHPNSVPLSELLGCKPQILYGVGLGLFGVAAYFYHISVKYMVKVGTPVPNGYQVKTLCTHGPFQYFQHPIYCALFGCSLSTPLVLDSAWSFLSPLAFWAYVYFLVVPRENFYMRDKFSAEHQRFVSKFSFNPLLFQ